MKRKGKRCPHCGNKDQDLIQSNQPPDWRRRMTGRLDGDEEETLLCMKMMKPCESSFEGDAFYAETADADGLVACGMQWDPWDEA